jgi:hypothetical protein
MANANGWGDGASNNNIGWGKGADNAIGWGSVYSVSEAGATDIVGTPAVDPDAQAFITAAAITDPTQQTAINTLVVDLKGYSIWSKMKALYPFVGGTAASHKFNLKDPRDLDAAFRLVFNGGWTHSANGAAPNGTNAWANTFVDLLNNTQQNSTSYGVYSRTNSNGTEVEIGAEGGSPAVGSNIFIRFSGITYARVNSTQSWVTFSDTDSRAFYISNRTASNVINAWKNNVKQTTGTTASSLIAVNVTYALGANNNSNNTRNYYSTKEQAFAFIGDGLTDTEAANFYTAVQAFQTTIGRSIGTQTVSDADAQAFVTAADIQDQVEATAINNLVIGMKADGLWTKMQAVYPMVGGTASQHKFNLKNPLDTDAAFRMTFHGGVTHSSNGITFATNGYADTKWLPSANSTTSNVSGGAYSRTNLTADYFLFGSLFWAFEGLAIAPKISDGRTFFGANNLISDNAADLFLSDTLGLFHSNRDSLTVSRLYKNGVSIRTSTPSSSVAPAFSVFLGARNYAGTANLYFNGNLAFAFLGDTLTLTEAANFYTAVQAFQTALSRNV